MRAMTGTTAAAALVLGLVAPPAVAGNQAGVDARGTSQGDVAGPGGPGVVWDTALPGYSFDSRHEDLVIDAMGHVLVQVNRDSDGRQVLIALDADDGSVAWTRLDIDSGCVVAADPDGLIFAQLVPGSPTAGAGNDNADLVAIDPADGGLVPGMRYTSPETDDEPRLVACADGLRLAGNGMLVVYETGPADDFVWGFDTTADSLTPAWVSEHTPPGADRTVISADGDALYLGYAAQQDPRELAIDRIDLATGVVEATSPPLGVTFLGVGALYADDDGVLAMTRLESTIGRGREALISLVDDGTSLVEDWRLVFDSDNPFTVDGEVFDENYGFGWWLTEVDGMVVGYARGRVMAVDRANGDPVWAHNAAGTNNHDEIIADAAGNTYFSSFGHYFLRSLDADGNVRWTWETDAYPEARRVGPFLPGGELLVGTTDASTGDIRIVAVQGTGTERVAGATRLETAVEVSQASFFEDGSADAVVLARGDNYPDALAGGPLARKVNGPILLSETASLSPVARTEIQRLDPDVAHVLGGTAALSMAVEDELRSMGLQVTRYAGADRFETAGLVANAVGGSAVYVTEGADPDPNRGWPDAVAVSGLASLQQRPILLVTTDALPAATAAAMGRLGVDDVTVAGGPVAVAEPVLGMLADHDGDGTDEATVRRVSGASRYATSAALADRSFDAGASAANLWFATGTAFPDALTAGPAAALTGGILLLVHGGDPNGGQEAYDWLAAVPSTDVDRLWFVGGPAAISQAVEDRIVATLD